MQLKGSQGSFPSLFSATYFNEFNQPVFLVYNDREEALYALNECEELMGKENVLFFPATALKPYQVEEVQNANIILRAEVLKNGMENLSEKIIISYTDAIFEKVIGKNDLTKNSFNIKIGDKIDNHFLIELLQDYDFHRTDFVTRPGEYSIRGNIIDVFSFSNEEPYRIVFFGNEVEKLKSFDIENQLSIQDLKTISLLPNISQDLSNTENRENIFKYLSPKTILIFKDLFQIKEKLNTRFIEADHIYNQLDSLFNFQKPAELFINTTEFEQYISSYKWIDFSETSVGSYDKIILLNQDIQPHFHKNFEYLIETLKTYNDQNYECVITFSNEKQQLRLKEIFADLDSNVHFEGLNFPINHGYIDHTNQYLIWTDHEIFERFHPFKSRDKFTKSETLTLKELTDLQIGDYVTHIDHGIGKFMGLKKINNDGKIQETIKIIYQNNDILYVNIYSLHKISKYSGKEGVEIQLNKLGSPAWQNLKNKTKKNVKKVAFDLIKLYAQRKLKEGFAYAPDSYLQNELEASFIYEDTPDQEKTTQEVKNDMEKPLAMDRLVCGDVGFGKTEIAIRAAFKAACDSKQTVVLVPTTILAFQHYKTFSERLKDFPVKVAYLNRFTSSKDKTQIMKDLETGKIDIIIGTHGLINKEVKYKDLGLLIVDEEHKFGVSVKDKLKTLKTTIDTLTLTATPIPRTLQFSLMSARDLSVIKTPPPNRQPIHTQLIGMNEELIRDAIIYELQRGGQLFFINNRIDNLPAIADMLKRLVPDIKVVIGHGQMDGKKLENNLLDFMKGKYDILISTTIVESGLDVPNANTIFINEAQSYGLADLHQMRGRVGRSNRKAFCYLITPPVSVLTDEARKRLTAIETFSDLGAGFNIAMKDLEIRGAGDLLGAEQSGFINDIGFDTYQKILNEAINELKNNEFSDLFSKESSSPMFSSEEVQIDTDLELLFPDEYINQVEERLSLYQKLSQISDINELQLFKTELEDRFGRLPPETRDLLESVELKWISKDLGIEKIIFKQNILLLYLPGNPEHKFYQSDIFSRIIQFIQNPKNQISLKEKQTKDGKSLFLRKEKVNTIKEIKELLISI